MSDYYSEPGISQSAIKALYRCPFYYERVYVYKDFNEDTEAMLFGRAVDHFITEPQRFTEIYIPVKRRGVAEVIPGTIELTQGMYDDVLGVGNFLLKQPVIQHYIENLTSQRVFSVERNGTILKAKLDWFGIEHGKTYIVDLKTTSAALWPKFKFSFRDYDYAFQLAWYKKLAQLSQIASQDFAYFLAVADKNRFINYEVSREVVRYSSRRVNKVLEEEPWKPENIEKRKAQMIGSSDGSHDCPLGIDCPIAIVAKNQHITMHDLI